MFHTEISYTRFCFLRILKQRDRRERNPKTRLNIHSREGVRVDRGWPRSKGRDPTTKQALEITLILLLI
jgi:hypothetical protein